MDSQEAIDNLNNDHTLLHSLLYGVTLSDQRELGECLTDLVSVLIARGRRCNPTTEIGAGCDDSNTTTGAVGSSALLETPPPLERLSDDVAWSHFRAAGNFLSLTLLHELHRSLTIQQNVHVFMRGNSAVPLLWESLGYQYVRPLLIQMQKKNNRSTESGDVGHRDDVVDRTGSDQSSTTRVESDIEEESQKNVDSILDHLSMDELLEFLCCEEVEETAVVNADASPVATKSSILPFSRRVCQAVDYLQDVDFLGRGEASSKTLRPAEEEDETLRVHIKTMQTFANSLWRSVENTCADWPLAMRWGLSAIFQQQANQRARGGMSPGVVSDEAVSSMLATIVILRMVSPHMMKYALERHPRLSTLDVFDQQSIAVRRRLTYVTKLLQKAAYQQPLHTAPPPLSTSSLQDASGGRRGDVASGEGAISNRLHWATHAINGVVMELATQIKKFWVSLCSPSALMEAMRELPWCAAHLNNDQDDAGGGFPAAVEGLIPVSAALTDAGPGTTGVGGGGDPASPNNASFGSSTTSSVRMLTRSESSAALSPVSGSPFRGEELCPQSLRLYLLVDRHATNMLRFMNVERPLGSCVHLSRLLNFSHFCARQLSSHAAAGKRREAPTFSSARSLTGQLEDAASDVTASSFVVVSAPAGGGPGSGNGASEDTFGIQVVPSEKKKKTTFAALASSIVAFRRKILKSDATPARSASSDVNSSSNSAVDARSVGSHTPPPSSGGAGGSKTNAGDGEDSSDPMRWALFRELVLHSARCRLQPETMNYTHYFGNLVGNRETVCSIHARDGGFDSPTTHNNNSVVMDESQEREPFASTLLVLHGDPLTEAVGLFSAQRERNIHILAKCLPSTLAYINKSSSSIQSILSDGALDAAAHLCFLLDIFAQSWRASKFLQILFFPPQEPLKCGCGKEWLKTVLQHLVPRAISQLIVQVVFAQPTGTPPRQKISSPSQLWQHVVHVPLLQAAMRNGGGELKGVKVLSVYESLEHLALGAEQHQPHSSIGVLLPTTELDQRLASTPTMRLVSIPLSLKDWTILRMEVRAQAQLLSSSSGGGGSQRSAAAATGMVFPSSPPPPSSSSFAGGNGSGGGSFPADPSLPAERNGFEVLDEFTDIWPLTTQRDVLEVVWSVSGRPNAVDVTAVGVPSGMLTGFRMKAVEWFSRFRSDIVAHLRGASTGHRSGSGLDHHQYVVGRHASGSVANSSSNAPGAASGRPAPTVRPRSSTIGSTTSLHSSNASITSVGAATLHHDPLFASSSLAKSGAYHCTWFGFLVERLHPADMAEFEGMFYNALCRYRSTSTSTDRIRTTTMSNTRTVMSSPPPAFASETMNSERELPPTPTSAAVSIAGSFGTVPPVSPAASVPTQAHVLSLSHVSLRCLWRMLLYSLSRTCSVLLHRPIHCSISSSGMNDNVRETTLWLRMVAVHRQWLHERMPSSPPASDVPPADGEEAQRLAPTASRGSTMVADVPATAQTCDEENHDDGDGTVRDKAPMNALSVISDVLMRHEQRSADKKMQHDEKSEEEETTFLEECTRPSAQQPSSSYLPTKLSSSCAQSAGTTNVNALFPPTHEELTILATNIAKLVGPVDSAEAQMLLLLHHCGLFLTHITPPPPSSTTSGLWASASSPFASAASMHEDGGGGDTESLITQGVKRIMCGDEPPQTRTSLHHQSSNCRNELRALHDIALCIASAGDVIAQQLTPYDTVDCSTSVATAGDTKNRAEGEPPQDVVLGQSVGSLWSGRTCLSPSQYLSGMPPSYAAALLPM